jgi:hypothetical protein
MPGTDCAAGTFAFIDFQILRRNVLERSVDHHENASIDVKAEVKQAGVNDHRKTSFTRTLTTGIRMDRFRFPLTGIPQATTVLRNAPGEILRRQGVVLVQATPDRD